MSYVLTYIHVIRNTKRLIRKMLRIRLSVRAISSTARLVSDGKFNMPTKANNNNKSKNIKKQKKIQGKWKTVYYTAENISP